MILTSTLKQIPITCSGHTRPITNLEFSNNYLISACKDGKPMIRSSDTGDWIATFEGHKGAVFGVSLDNSSKLAASGAADFTAKIWDVETGKEKHNFDHNHVVKTVAFSKDNKNILTGGNEKLLKVFDLHKPSKSEIIELYSGHSGNIKRAFFCNDDKCIISCAERDNKIRFWDRRTGKEMHFIEFKSFNPSSIEISNDGNILTVASGSTVSFHDMGRMVKINEVNVSCNLEGASLHPEKLFFVCGGEDFKIYKFDYSTLLEIESYKGHFGPVHCISFSKNGELYASGSEDGTLRLWQTTVGKTIGLWKCVNNNKLK